MVDALINPLFTENAVRILASDVGNEVRECVIFAFIPTAFPAIKKYGPCVQVCVAEAPWSLFFYLDFAEKSKGKWKTEESQSQGGGVRGDHSTSHLHISLKKTPLMYTL